MRWGTVTMKLAQTHTNESHASTPASPYVQVQHHHHRAPVEERQRTTHCNIQTSLTTTALFKKYTHKPTHNHTHTHTHTHTQTHTHSYTRACTHTHDTMSHPFNIHHPFLVARWPSHHIHEPYTHTQRKPAGTVNDQDGNTGPAKTRKNKNPDVTHHTCKPSPQHRRTHNQ